MGGRLHVYVLVVVIAYLRDPAVAARPQSPLTDFMYHLASRCRSVAGEQAAADLTNLLHFLMSCTDFEQLYAEAQQHLETDNVRGLVETFCRKKDHLMTCARQGLQRVERCLLPQEKFTETAEQVLEATGNFFCKNIDGLASIADSLEERGCVVQLEDRTAKCAMQTLETNDGGEQYENVLKFLESKEKTCQMYKEKLRCVNELTGKCKDSTLLRLVNSYGKEVLDEISCPNGLGATTIYTSGAAGLLALLDVLPGVTGHLVLSLAAQHAHYLQ